MEHKNDLDLDIMNLLKDFPENDSEGFIYARVNRDLKVTEDKNEGFLLSRCTTDTFGHLITALILNNNDSKLMVFNAVCGYLDRNRDELDVFIEALNNMKNNNKE